MAAEECMGDRRLTLAFEPPRGAVLLLARMRATAIRNRLRQTVRERPLKVFGSAASVLLIWGGLYVLLDQTFQLIKRPVLEGIVATPLVFTFFFLALTGMLAFSTGILSYGALFKRSESGYLLSTPLPPRDVVIVKYLECLVLSSWSLVLLGLPLMMAMGRNFDESWTFYPLFLGIFLLFIPVPGALGLFLSWLIVMTFPKTPKRAIAAGLAVLGIPLAVWLYRVAAEPVTSSEWLKNFYDRIGLLQSALLPHTWVSRGINYALQDQPGEALFYLMVVLANALMASVAVVAVVSKWFIPAYARAQSAGSKNVRRSGRVVGMVAEALFAYLPGQQRMLAVKDVKTFFRDPLQWSQMAILFGLLMLYVTNANRMWLTLADPRLQALIAFLNLTAVSLILATFTSRFVFPLVSLEGQQLWLLGLLPLTRRRMVTAKFLYALTLTALAAVAVMGVSVYRLALPRPLAAAHLMSAAAICVGLCGVSIGMGARMPVFTERNPARIAGGFGGTVNLLMSIGLVVASLAAVGWLSLRAAAEDFGDRFTGAMLAWIAIIVAVNGAAAAVAMTVGIRHFEKVEC